MEGAAGCSTQYYPTGDVFPTIPVPKPMPGAFPHILQDEWTLWYYEYVKGTPWDQCQHEISSVKTVEQFWTLHENIKQASDIDVGCDYALFKNGIRPMWEDEMNRMGGRWIISVDKGCSSNELNALWIDLLLHLIGLNFTFADDVCGAVLSVRPRRNKIAVWIRRVSVHMIRCVGNEIKNKLNLTDDAVMNFEYHDEKVNGQARV